LPIEEKSPKSGQSKHLLTNYAINIVVGAEEETNPYHCQTARGGVNILITTYVKVVVRYKKYLYKCLQNGDIVSCPDESVQMIRCYRDRDIGNNDENHNPTKVEVCDYFSYNDKFCKVFSVTAMRTLVLLLYCLLKKRVTRKLSFNYPKFSKFIAEI
jgi:hypothetical protein